MRILILGASGYVGSRIRKILDQEYEVFGTYRTEREQYCQDSSMYPYVLGDQEGLEKLLHKINPGLAVSCLTGDFQQQKEAHRILGEFLSRKENGKVIFLSSANVFDGALEKPHLESDPPKAESEYGRTADEGGRCAGICQQGGNMK